jgi:hypothetical protein
MANIHLPKVNVLCECYTLLHQKKQFAFARFATFVGTTNAHCFPDITSKEFNMAKIILTPHFRSIAELKEHFATVLPRPHDWRLMEPIVGQIHGIPTSHGVAIATNGILVAIEQQGRYLFIGHVATFVPDEQETQVMSVVKKSKDATKPVTPKRPTIDISEFY